VILKTAQTPVDMIWDINWVASLIIDDLLRKKEKSTLRENWPGIDHFYY
jgi:hypothetical protein